MFCEATRQSARASSGVSLTNCVVNFLILRFLAFKLKRRSIHVLNINGAPRNRASYNLTINYLLAPHFVNKITTHAETGAPAGGMSRFVYNNF